MATKTEIEVKITRIGEKWHARLVENGAVLDEAACELKCDIGWICRELIRWYSKLGGVSEHASSARLRQKNGAAGKTWTGTQLAVAKGKRKFGANTAKTIL